MLASPHPRDSVARTPTELGDLATAMLDWGIRLAIMGAFSFTLTQLRGLAINILKIPFDLNLIANLTKSLSYLNVKNVSSSSAPPKDFRLNGDLRTSIDIIYRGFSAFAQTKNPIELAKALRQIKDLMAINFEKDQILSMEIEAQFQFPVCMCMATILCCCLDDQRVRHASFCAIQIDFLYLFLHLG